MSLTSAVLLATPCANRASNDLPGEVPQYAAESAHTPLPQADLIATPCANRASNDLPGEVPRRTAESAHTPLPQADLIATPCANRASAEQPGNDDIETASVATGAAELERSPSPRDPLTQPPRNGTPQAGSRGTTPAQTPRPGTRMHTPVAIGLSDADRRTIDWIAAGRCPSATRYAEATFYATENGHADSDFHVEAPAFFHNAFLYDNLALPDPRAIDDVPFCRRVARCLRQAGASEAPGREHFEAFLAQLGRLALQDLDAETAAEAATQAAIEAQAVALENARGGNRNQPQTPAAFLQQATGQSHETFSWLFVPLIFAAARGANHPQAARTRRRLEQRGADPGLFDEAVAQIAGNAPAELLQSVPWTRRRGERAPYTNARWQERVVDATLLVAEARGDFDSPLQRIQNVAAIPAEQP